MSRQIAGAKAIATAYQGVMELFLADLSPAYFAYAVLIACLGGFVKGVVGFGLPLVMISGLSILIAPDIAVAAIILPVLITNLWQTARGGLAQAGIALQSHWRYILLVCVMILISAQFLRSFSSSALLTILGVPVVVLCLIQIAGWRPRIAPRYRPAFEWVAGTLAGILGGLTTTWGPPTVLYLLALETPRQRQMAVQGVIYGLGSIMLLLGHLKSGVLNDTTIWLSAALVPAGLLGIWLGFRLGDRFDQEKFRKVTLWVLAIAGLNLIRKGVLG